MAHHLTSNWPENVGIRAIELYYPKLFVDQAKLEVFDGCQNGKYTLGLGQLQMGIASDLEDVNSVCLTVVRRLLDRYKIAISQIGRVEVGTESQIDKSKSVKSQLMRLLLSANGTLLDAEGADTINACYGGTQALFNAVNWVESSNCMGRLALVVMGDIAVYAPGPARCTGGAGACAMIIGSEAPLVFDRCVRVTSMQHAYDFYKPSALNSEFALFDGPNSVKSYSTCLDDCYERYKQRAEEVYGESVDLGSFDNVLFHSPYCKLVEKSLARLNFLDLRQKFESNDESLGTDSNVDELKPFLSEHLSSTYGNKDLERATVKATKSIFQSKTNPTLLFACRIGNMYTPSLYSGLLAILAQAQDNHTQLHGKRVLFFSYGSGSCSAMFSLRIRAEGDSIKQDGGSLLSRMVEAACESVTRLEARTESSPEQYTLMMLQRQLLVKAPHKPKMEPNACNLFPGTYYLTAIDDKYRREYSYFE